MLCEKYGGKWFFGGGIFAASLFGLLSPIAAKTSPYLLITVRAFQGAFIGPLFPGILCMGSRWFPVQEKNKLMTFVQAGKSVSMKLEFTMFECNLVYFIHRLPGWYYHWISSRRNPGFFPWLGNCFLCIRSFWLCLVHILCFFCIFHTSRPSEDIRSMHALYLQSYHQITLL